MPETTNVHNETFFIRSYDVRPDGTAKLTALCNFLQEAAGNHAHELNYDIKQLQGTNRTWVLYRLQLEMQRYPRWGDEVSVETWPSGGEGITAYRDFLFTDQNQKILGRGTSQWMILDLKKGRPLRIPEEIFKMKVSKRRHMLTPRRDKITLPEQKEADTAFIFRVRRSDLDLNGHVNNVAYINWITESVPRSIFRNYHLSYLDIKFLTETKLGDQINSRCFKNSPKSNEFKHKIARSGDQTDLSVAQSIWDISENKSDGKS